MADNLFVPFHRSYRLSLTLAVLLGGFMILSYTLWRDLEVCRQEARQCCTRAQELENQVPFLQGEIDALNEKYQLELRNAEEMQKTISDLRGLVEDLQARLDQALNQNQNSQTSIRELESMLAEKKAVLINLEDELRQLRAMTTVLEIKVSSFGALSSTFNWLSRRWQVSSALLFAGIVAPAALLRRKVRKFQSRAARGLHSRPTHAGSTWMLVSRSEAKTISQKRRAH